MKGSGVPAGTWVQGSPNIHAQPEWEAGKTPSPQERSLAEVTGLSTLSWDQVLVAAELLQEKDWGEDRGKSPC